VLASILVGFMMLNGCLIDSRVVIQLDAFKNYFE